LAGNANLFAVDLLGAPVSRISKQISSTPGGTSSVNTGVTPYVVVTDTVSACSGQRPANYDAALALVKAQGTSEDNGKSRPGSSVWPSRAAISQVPRSDDRPLYSGALR
jgi:hypothetical protein